MLVKYRKNLFFVQHIFKNIVFLSVDSCDDDIVGGAISSNSTGGDNQVLLQHGVQFLIDLSRYICYGLRNLTTGTAGQAASAFMDPLTDAFVIVTAALDILKSPLATAASPCSDSVCSDAVATPHQNNSTTMTHGSSTAPREGAEYYALMVARCLLQAPMDLSTETNPTSGGTASINASSRVTHLEVLLHHLAESFHDAYEVLNPSLRASGFKLLSLVAEVIGCLLASIGYRHTNKRHTLFDVMLSKLTVYPAACLYLPAVFQCAPDVILLLNASEQQITRRLMEIQQTCQTGIKADDYCSATVPTGEAVVPQHDSQQQQHPPHVNALWTVSLAALDIIEVDTPTNNDNLQKFVNHIRSSSGGGGSTLRKFAIRAASECLIAAMQASAPSVRSKLLSSIGTKCGLTTILLPHDDILLSDNSNGHGNESSSTVLSKKNMKDAITTTTTVATMSHTLVKSISLGRLYGTIVKAILTDTRATTATAALSGRNSINVGTGDPLLCNDSIATQAAVCTSGSGGHAVGQEGLLCIRQVIASVANVVDGVLSASHAKIATIQNEYNDDNNKTPLRREAATGLHPSSNFQSATSSNYSSPWSATGGMNSTGSAPPDNSLQQQHDSVGDLANFGVLVSSFFAVVTQEPESELSGIAGLPLDIQRAGAMRRSLTQPRAPRVVTTVTAGSLSGATGRGSVSAVARSDDFTLTILKMVYDTVPPLASRLNAVEAAVTQLGASKSEVDIKYDDSSSGVEQRLEIVRVLLVDLILAVLSQLGIMELLQEFPAILRRCVALSLTRRIARLTESNKKYVWETNNNIYNNDDRAIPPVTGLPDSLHRGVCVRGLLLANKVYRFYICLFFETAGSMNLSPVCVNDNLSGATIAGIELFNNSLQSIVGGCLYAGTSHTVPAVRLLAVETLYMVSWFVSNVTARSMQVMSNKNDAMPLSTMRKTVVALGDILDDSKFPIRFAGGICRNAWSALVSSRDV
eukprot:Lankesteria_metandrocarpae@DN4678_c0_g2_i1.p1